MTTARSSHGGQAEFCRAQALSMMEQAQAAVLANVRERCVRSAAAWNEMAARAERHLASLERSEAAKAAAVAALQ